MCNEMKASTTFLKIVTPSIVKHGREKARDSDL